MCKKLVCLVAASALSAAAAAIANVDAQALLRQSDAQRNGSASYAVRIKITNFEAGKQDEEHLYAVAQKGLDKTHIEFLSPREKGRFLLMLGDDMWVYLPDTSRPVRITPLERLTGEASNGDVARTNYAYDYDAVYLRTEKVGEVECHVLELTARRKGSTYHKIEFWVRAEDARPVKAEFYLTSGKHIKSATFDAYRQDGERTRLARMTIYDQIRKGSRSVLEYSNFEPRELPDALFHQGRVNRF
ncbi:MAG: outer membrane lipoprotein-sorting protein [Terriglobia bacterium]|nr:MAG: outer membrane lipoprotein-sorting protein [Terriglobia bacterium]